MNRAWNLRYWRTSAGLDLLRKETGPGVHNPPSCWDTAGVDAPRCPEAGISRPGRPGGQRQGRKLLASTAASPRLPTAARDPGMPVPTGPVPRTWWVQVFVVGWTSGGVSQSGVGGDGGREGKPPWGSPHSKRQTQLVRSEERAHSDFRLRPLGQSQFKCDRLPRRVTPSVHGFLGCADPETPSELTPSCLIS